MELHECLAACQFANFASEIFFVIVKTTINNFLRDCKTRLIPSLHSVLLRYQHVAMVSTMKAVALTAPVN